HPLTDEQGDPQAAELLPLVYDELRKLAAANLEQETPGQTLQATALVHYAYIQLDDVEKVQHWNSRGHFFSTTARLCVLGPRLIPETALLRGSASLLPRSLLHGYVRRASASLTS